jgi:hypothetical protein
MRKRIARRSRLRALAGGVAFASRAWAQQARASIPVVINSVRIFGGLYDQLRPGNILISDRTISQIFAGPITLPPNTTVIDARGRVLAWPLVQQASLRDVQQKKCGP